MSMDNFCDRPSPLGKRVDINENEPHKVSEVICVHCGWRWLAVRHIETLLKSLECPDCMNQGKVIETGEVITDK